MCGMERARQLVTLNYYAFFAWNMCNKCIMGKLCVSIHLFHFWTYLTDSSLWKLMLKIIKQTLFGFVFVQYNPWEPGCIVCVMLRLWVGQSRVWILVGQEIFVLCKTSRWAPVPNQCPIQFIHSFIHFIFRISIYRWKPRMWKLS